MKGCIRPWVWSPTALTALLVQSPLMLALLLLLLLLRRLVVVLLLLQRLLRRLVEPVMAAKSADSASTVARCA